MSFVGHHCPGEWSLCFGQRWAEKHWCYAACCFI